MLSGKTNHSGKFQDDFKVSRVEERTFRDPCLCKKRPYLTENLSYLAILLQTVYVDLHSKK